VLQFPTRAIECVMCLGQNRPRDYGKHQFTIPIERSIIDNGRLQTDTQIHIAGSVTAVVHSLMDDDRLQTQTDTHSW